jgi:hypothetical protein
MFSMVDVGIVFGISGQSRKINLEQPSDQMECCGGAKDFLFRSAANASDFSRRPAYQPQNEEQHDCADEGNEDGAPHSAERSGYSEHAEEPAANECTHDAYDDVTDNAVSGSAHYERRENSSDETNYDPGQDAHGVCPQKIVGAVRMAPVKCCTASTLPHGPKISD